MSLRYDTARNLCVRQRTDVAQLLRYKGHMWEAGDPITVLDFRSGKGRKPFAVYEDFGVRCALHVPDRVLLWAGEGDADVHYTLADVLVTVSRIVRERLGMKVALVTLFPAVAQVACAMQLELLELGCELRVFAAEAEALRWLAGRAAVRPSADATPRPGMPGRPESRSLQPATL